MSQWSRATVNIDYHVACDGDFYSVPYALVQQVVEVRSTPTTVEIFHKGRLIVISRAVDCDDTCSEAINLGALEMIASPCRRSDVQWIAIRTMHVTM